MRTTRGGARWLGAATLGAVAVVTLTAGPAAAAPAARPAAPLVCNRVQNQWARVVANNDRAKAAFQRASALQAQLVRRHRPELARRLDARLQHLRDLHTTLVARVSAIAARVRGVCPQPPPTLVSY
jgi:hypothetical protein